MIRVERYPDQGAKDALRFFHDDQAPDMAEYDATCTVHWVAPSDMWIHGLLVRRGRMNRKWLLELLDIAEQGGAQWIKSKRAPGHTLPGGIVQPNGEVWVHVAEMRARFPFDTTFAPLL